VISDEGRIEVTAYLHCRLDFCNAILAETANVVIKRLISSEYRGSFSIRNKVLGLIHYFTQTTLAFGVVQNRLQARVQSCLHLYINSTYRLKILEVVLGCGRQLDGLVWFSKV